MLLPKHFLVIARQANEMLQISVTSAGMLHARVGVCVPVCQFDSQFRGTRPEQDRQHPRRQTQRREVGMRCVPTGEQRPVRHCDGVERMEVKKTCVCTDRHMETGAVSHNPRPTQPERPNNWNCGRQFLANGDCVNKSVSVKKCGREVRTLTPNTTKRASTLNTHDEHQSCEEK